MTIAKQYAEFLKADAKIRREQAQELRARYNHISELHARGVKKVVGVPCRYLLDNLSFSKASV